METEFPGSGIFPPSGMHILSLMVSLFPGNWEKSDSKLDVFFFMKTH